MGQHDLQPGCWYMLSALPVERACIVNGPCVCCVGGVAGCGVAMAPRPSISDDVISFPLHIHREPEGVGQAPCCCAT